jgi:hypothetical protein
MKDITKLPRWAQWEIQRLRANEEFAILQKTQAEKDMLERGRLELGEDKVITWVLRVDGEIDVTAYDGVLEIEPRASKTVTLRVKRFGER